MICQYCKCCQCTSSTNKNILVNVTALFCNKYRIELPTTAILGMARVTLAVNVSGLSIIMLLWVLCFYIILQVLIPEKRMFIYMWACRRTECFQNIRHVSGSFIKVY